MTCISVEHKYKIGCTKCIKKNDEMTPKINKMAPIQNVAPKINKMATT